MPARHKKIGEKGQRYEIHVIGYPEPGDNVAGWAANNNVASRAAIAMLSLPTAERAYVLDRQTRKIVGRGQHGKPWVVGEWEMVKGFLGA